MPISASEVKAYRDFPAGAKELGFFSIELLEKNNPIEAQEKMVDYARVLAAGVGANGIVIEQLARGDELWYLMGKAVGV
jgi:alpha-glucuronidase